VNFDVASLVASFLIGLVGFGLYLYGKKQQRLPQLFVGVALMIYPYFVPSVAVMVAIAVGLLGVMWVVIQRGL
jgi:hypothetical protein